MERSSNMKQNSAIIIVSDTNVFWTKTFRETAPNGRFNIGPDKAFSSS